MGAYKNFDESLYNLNNQKAIDAVLATLDAAGIQAGPNEDQYGPDIQLRDGSSYIEVEVKSSWVSSRDGASIGAHENHPSPEQASFRYPTLQIPERKRRYAEKFPELDIEYWVLSSDLRYALCVSRETLLSSPLVEVPNRLVASGELFVQVPVSNCTLICLISATYGATAPSVGAV